jgi:hypothetical protein
MKRLTHLVGIVTILGAVLLALPSQVLATAPKEVVFLLDMHPTVPDGATGSFDAAGAIDDEGTVSETFRFTDEGTVQGVKVFVSDQGTITMRFNAELTPIRPMAFRTEAHWVIASGTGAYENLHGVGTGEVVLDFAAGSIVGPFSGTVHVDS